MEGLADDGEGCSGVGFYRPEERSCANARLSLWLANNGGAVLQAAASERLLAAAWLCHSTGRRDEAGRGGAAQAMGRCEQAVVRHVAGEVKLDAMVSSAALLVCACPVQ